MRKMKISKKLSFLALVSAIFMFASCVGTTNPETGTNTTDNGGGRLNLLRALF